MARLEGRSSQPDWRKGHSYHMASGSGVLYLMPPDLWDLGQLSPPPQSSLTVLVAPASEHPSVGAVMKMSRAETVFADYATLCWAHSQNLGTFHCY